MIIQVENDGMIESVDDEYAPLRVALRHKLISESGEDSYYTNAVMDWHDAGMQFPFTIMNGIWGLDCWSVIESAPEGNSFEGESR